MNTNLQASPNDVALNRLLNLCKIKSYPAKHTIMKPGDTGNRLYFIVSGSASVFVEGDNGNELILAYLHKDEFIGEAGVFEGAEIRKARIETRSECRLAEISYERFHRALNKELRAHAPVLLFILGKQITNRLMLTKRNLCDLAFMDVEGRVAQTLVDLCKQPDAITHPDGMQLHITRQEISRIVGCTREMVGRVLKLLMDKDMIFAHGKTIVVYGTR